MAIDELAQTTTEQFRTYPEWGSIRGLRKDILPWRLYDKAKKLMWDPADLDYSKDAEQWAAMSMDQKVSIFGLATGFMVGEEGVTLDILPLLLAISDEGRTEETMFLTTFAFEEAKHVDFFNRWFEGVGIDIHEMDQQRLKWLREQGIEPLKPEERHFMFQRELPRVMRRLMNERSDETVLDAAVTYNQFVEGCLAIAGYKVWGQMFEQFGVLPALQEGLVLIQRDERRHIAYGTYLCRRILQSNPGLFEFARDRMLWLRDNYFGALRVPGYGAEENGSNAPPPSSITAAFMPFIDYVETQCERRIEVLSKAREIASDEAVTGSDVEETEEELERV
jgi:ribonucleoside-diphosphate reductase beta chain